MWWFPSSRRALDLNKSEYWSSGVLENWKRILIVFLPLLQNSITPLPHKRILNVKYKEDEEWQTK
jgi:hypothetical protein